MNCADVDRLLSEGSVEEARSHIETCARCRALVGFAVEPLPEFAVSAAMTERIQAMLREDLAPVRPLPGTGVWVLGGAALAAAWCGVHYFLFGAAGWTAMSALQLSALLILTLLVIGAAAVALFDSVRPGSRQRLPVLAPAGSLAVGFPLLAGVLYPVQLSPHFVRDGVMCLAVGLSASAIVGGLAYLVARRGYPTDRRRTGALLGVVGGAISVAGLSVECPAQEFLHLAVWHGLVILLSIAAGFLAGAAGVSRAGQE
jgi:hypothetical protein